MIATDRGWRWHALGWPLPAAARYGYRDRPMMYKFNNLCQLAFQWSLDSWQTMRKSSYPIYSFISGAMIAKMQSEALKIKFEEVRPEFVNKLEQQEVPKWKLADQIEETKV